MVRWEVVTLVEWVMEEPVHLGSWGRSTVKRTEFDTAEFKRSNLFIKVSNHFLPSRRHLQTLCILASYPSCHCVCVCVCVCMFVCVCVRNR